MCNGFGNIHFSLYCLTLYILEIQEGWCDSRGTLQEVKAKLQMRQEGAFKRERALAYSLAQKVQRRLCYFNA